MRGCEIVGASWKSWETITARDGHEELRVSTENRQLRVGRRLRELRESLGLTRAALSKATGVNTNSIVRLEGGQDVRVSSYLRIMDYFIEREPTVSALAERFVLLTPEQQTAILASMEDAGATMS